MPDLNLDEIKRRCEKATKGPWELRPRNVGGEQYGSLREVDCEIVGNVMIAEVERLRKCLENIEAAPEIQKDPDAQVCPEDLVYAQGLCAMASLGVVDAQMAAISFACCRRRTWKAALKEAANICDEVFNFYHSRDYHKYSELSALAPEGARVCEEKIRALKSKTEKRGQT